MTKEPEKVQLTVITQEIEDTDDPPAALAGDREGSASSSAGGTGGESSEGEGDIEIEHVGDESGVSSGGAGGSVHGLLPSGNITFDVRRRTLINIYQRTILEEFYRCGMTSASLMLNHLHTAAAEKTGLDISVVKNWIRNRRRPTAVKSAEKFVEKISQGNLPPVPTIPNIPSLPTNMTSMGLSTPSALSSDSSVVMSSAQPSTSNLSSLGRTLATHLSLPEPKRVCTESAVSGSLSIQLPPVPHSQPVQQQAPPSQPPPPPLQPQHHHHGHSISVSIPQPQLPPQSSLATSHHALQLTPPLLSSSTSGSSSSLAIPQTVITSTSSASNNSNSSSQSQQQHQQQQRSGGESLLVKVRVSGSGESDFVEVEVPSLSYSSLLKSCCEELELVPHEIAKIRKLPNVWVRKDKDVQRMKEGQELEIIVKSAAVSSSANPNSTPPPITTMLTVNPFSLAAAAASTTSNLTLITSGASISGGSHGLGGLRGESDGLLAALTTDGPVSMPELTNVVAGGGTPGNQVNGLH